MTNIDLDQFNGPCGCGMDHELSVKEVYLEPGAIRLIPQILSKDKYKDFNKFVMVCDDNTYDAAGKEVEPLIPGIATVKLNPDGLHADDIGVQKLSDALDSMPAPDCLIAVGSGTIHDITRYVAYERNIPFISVPTAASVDGYVSRTAAMTWHGFKSSMQAVSPIMVIADSDVIAAAPMRLTASGVGDLLGKYTALCDWKIANLVTGEYICDRICSMQEEALQNMIDSLPGLTKGDIDAYEKLMYGLLLSGLAMQMAGQSRPASGAEHQIAHLWEMAVINPPTDAYHGEKVGVALLMVSDVYHKAAEYLRKGGYSVLPEVDVETGLIESTFRDPSVRERILKTNTPNPMDKVDPQILEASGTAIADLIDAVPTSDDLRDLLNIVHGKTTMEEIGIDPGLYTLTLMAAPYIKDRITFLRLLKFYDFYDEVIN